ncbi:MAG: zinc ribbon domain-containing protein [Clostridiales bacterium]|nr:zinc ribbon domain-containing protein [Clostridiales bacterium]
MKSIKPGRGPSMMGGVMSIAIGVFGVIWTIAALRIGGGFFALFGVVFVIIAIVQAVYHFKNATNENRYSSFDIVDGEEEPDPLNQRWGESRGQGDARIREDGTESSFCPYCGSKTERDYVFCSKCGKKLP